FEETSAQYATPAIPATGFGASRLSNAGKRVAGRRGVRRRTEIGGPPGGPSAPEGLRSSRPYVRNCFPAILGSMQTAMIDRIAAAPYDLLRRNRVPMNSVWTKEKANLRSGRGHLQLILAFVALSLIAADAPTTVGTANEQGFLTDIKSLTAPAMEGRGAGTKGLTRAAHLIEQRYKSLGLQPTGKNGFFQPFDVITGAQLRPGNELAKYVQ